MVRDEERGDGQRRSDDRKEAVQCGGYARRYTSMVVTWEMKESDERRIR